MHAWLYMTCILLHSLFYNLYIQNNNQKGQRKLKKIILKRKRRIPASFRKPGIDHDKKFLLVRNVKRRGKREKE